MYKLPRQTNSHVAWLLHYGDGLSTQAISDFFALVGGPGHGYTEPTIRGMIKRIDTRIERGARKFQSNPRFFLHPVQVPNGCPTCGRPFPSH